MCVYAESSVQCAHCSEVHLVHCVTSIHTYIVAQGSYRYRLSYLLHPMYHVCIQYITVH